MKKTRLDDLSNQAEDKADAISFASKRKGIILRMKSVIRQMNLVFSLVLQAGLILGLSPSILVLAAPSKKVQLIEVNAQIEKLISDGYRDKISTQLDPTTFKVGAVVTLREVIETYAVQKKGPMVSTVRSLSETVSPTDLSTGVIQMYPLLDQYKKQLDDLQNRMTEMARNDQNVVGESPTEKKPKYLVNGVEVIVGIDEGLNPEQRKEFEEWLKDSVTRDFGPRGTYKISLLKKIIVPKEPPKVTILTRFDKISRLQVLLGFALFGIILLVLLVLYKFLPARGGKQENNHITVQIQQENKQSPVATETAPERRSQSPRQSSKQYEAGENRGPLSHIDHLGVIAQNYREVQGKIGYLYFSTPGIISPLFDTWYDQGLNGRLKAAALIDAVLSCAENTEQKLLVFPEKWRKDEELPQAFRAFPGLSLEDRNKILDEGYWDMLALNMLGRESLKSHFEILGHLPTEKLQRLLANREPKVKALTLMHLPQEKAHNYITELDRDEKKRLVQDSLQLESIKEEDLKTLDESLKMQLAVEQKAEGLVSVVDRIPNLLRGLTPKEEMEWLPEAVERLPDQGLKLKRSYPSLAFLKDWPDDALAVYFSGVDSKMTTVFLKMAPSLLERIVKLYPGPLATIIRDEMSVKRGLSEKEQNKVLQQLKERLILLTENGDISLERIFKTNSDESFESSGPRRRVA